MAGAGHPIERTRCRSSSMTRIPTVIGTGSSRSTARSRRSRWTSTRTAESVPATSSSSTRYDLGVDIELARRAAAASASSIRRCAAVIMTSAQGPHLLLGRQHLHARPVVARVEGQLLQVHERDAQRHRGREPPFRASSSSPPCNGTTRRRRLRARARLRRDPADRRSVVGGEPAGGAAARRAARHRRPDARSPTSATCAATIADIFCTLTEGVRAQRAKEWRLIDDHAKPQQFANAVSSARAGARRDRATGPRRRDGRRAAAARAHDRRPRLPLRLRRRATIDRARAHRDAHGAARLPPRARRTSTRSSRARRVSGGRSRWRASSTTRS